MTELLEYKPPKWASKMENIPKYYVKLANTPTPIQKWDLPGLPPPFQVFSKRDDATGCTLSGNKVRKLEFILAEVLQNGYDGVITYGALQSNHCATTAIAARQLGLKCYLMLHADEMDTENCGGNLLLNKLVGAEVYLVPKEDCWSRALQLAEKVRIDKNEKCYVMRNGGSCHFGVFGYVHAFQEMIDQNVLENFDDIVVAISSSGTATGICLANYLTGSKLKVHAVSACSNSTRYYRSVQNALQKVGIKNVRSEDVIDIIDDYVGKGHAQSTEEELELLIEISQKTGIIVDPDYDIKAIIGMMSEMKKNPKRFKGERILFINTGGLFVLFDGRISSVLLNQAKKGKAIFRLLENCAQEKKEPTTKIKERGEK